MKNKKILFLVSLLFIALLIPLAKVNAAGEFCTALKSIRDITWKVGGSIIIIGWVVAGILWLTSGGSPEKTGIAKKAMIAAITGTILVLLSATAATIIKDALGTGSSEECTSLPYV